MKETAFPFRADESAKAGVLRLADDLIGAALRRARRPSRNPAEDVHFFRATTKRLRALLQLIRPVIARTAFESENARLKRAAFRLAPFRDCAVARETLKALGQSAAVLWKICRVDSTDKAQAKGDPRGAMRAAAHDLEQSRRGFRRMRIRGESWDAIGPGLMTTYTQARNRMKAAIADPSDPAFHRWRIRVKQLCYQLHWLEAVWPKRFGRMLKRLRKLEGKLGGDHDLVILRTLLETTPGTCDADVIKQVKKSAAKASRRLRRAGERLGAKALRETPRRFRRGCEKRWGTVSPFGRGVGGG